MSDNAQRNRQVVALISNTATDMEKYALATWASKMLQIRAGTLSPAQKARSAIQLTAQSSVVVPMVKIASKELKHIAWDDRGWAGRLGLVGASVGALVFGGSGAGIAALGGAIGVPLWVVLGSGAAFAGVLVEEFNRPSGHE